MGCPVKTMTFLANSISQISKPWAFHFLTSSCGNALLWHTFLTNFPSWFKFHGKFMLLSPKFQDIAHDTTAVSSKKNSFENVCEMPIIFEASVTWTSCSLKSPAIRLFVQQLMRTHINETSKSVLLFLCEVNSPVTGEFTEQRASNEKKAWWRHQMEPFSALLALCAGHKGQWRGALMFSVIFV